jgi:putative transposase
MCAQKLDSKIRIKNIDCNNKKISLQRQCELLSINRSTFYYEAKPDDHSDEVIVEKIEAIHIEHPALGYRKIHVMLQDNGYQFNHKKILRLMQKNGIKVLFPKHKTTIGNKQHKKVKYLLKDLQIVRPNQVWAVDITYIKIRGGYVYLFGIIDVFSRKVIGWRLSPFLDTKPCIEAFEEALTKVFPEIVNSDQGCQFTSEAWAKLLLSCGIKMSMDGKGRWADNIFIERFWRTIKYELIAFYSFETLEQLKVAIEKYIMHYNTERPHQSLNYKTPEFVYTTAQGPITQLSKNKAVCLAKKNDEELPKVVEYCIDNLSLQSLDLVAQMAHQQSGVIMRR